MIHGKPRLGVLLCIAHELPEQAMMMGIPSQGIPLAGTGEACTFPYSQPKQLGKARLEKFVWLLFDMHETHRHIFESLFDVSNDDFSPPVSLLAARSAGGCQSAISE